MKEDIHTLIRAAIRRFLIYTLATAVILGIIYVIAINTSLAHYFSPAIPWLLIFFVVIFNLVYFLQLKSTQSRNTKFVSVALLSTSFKLLLFLIILVVYALLNRNDAVNFIFAFLILYLIFTPLEVINQQKVQRKLKGK
ncbi:MAG TPA: hypothetical protein VFC92_09760 [Bacteroidales bacterium]|nr:hypothetical protein [Bacteroidales bacterium]